MDIDQICHQHYSEFLGSVTELLSIRKLTNELREEVIAYNEDFFQSARTLTDALEDIEVATLSRDDSGSLRRTASECFSLSELMFKARESMKDKNFHATVETLKRIQLSDTSDTRFLSQYITDKSWFPDISHQLMDLETAEVDAFLLEIRLDASIYGTTLLRRNVHGFQTKCSTQIKRLQDLKTLDHHRHYTYSTFYFWRFGSAFNLTDWIEQRDFDQIASLHYTQEIPSDGILKLSSVFDKLGPLFHALRTCSLLNQSDSFFEHYRNIRKVEFDKAIDAAGKAIAKHGLLNSFPSLCSVIVGLFAIETLFIRCISEADALPLSSPFESREINRLWGDICSRILSLVQKHLTTLDNPNHVLSMKEDILLLVDVVQDPALNLSPEPLFAIVDVLWSAFDSIQQLHLMKVVDKCISDSLCQQYKVASQSVLKSTVSCFNLDTASMRVDHSSNSPYPKLFAFSAALPVMFRELHLFVLRYFMYTFKCANLSLKGDAVCKSVLTAFESIARLYSNALKVDGTDTTVSKACQVLIDATCLSSGSDALWTMMEKMLSHFRWTESMNLFLPRTIVSAKTCISKLATQSQEFMFDLLGAKIDELLTSMTMIDWKPSRRPAENSRSYIDELIDFLRITLGCLSSLPNSAIEAAYFTTCSRVSAGVINFLISSSVTAVNINCLLSLEMDMMKLEKFAEDSAILNLSQCFTELNSLISALTSTDLISISIDDSRGLEKRQQRYPQLNVRHLAIIIDKVISCANPTVGRVTSAGPITLSTLDLNSLKTLAKTFRRLPRQ